MKITYHGHITLGMIGGEDHEYAARFQLSHAAGCPEHWDKSIGTWLPADPPETEVLSGQVCIEDQWHELPQWFLDSVAADQEALTHFNEFIADEMNRGPDD